MSHRHYYDVHPNQAEWPNHLFCTICGFASPAHLAALGVEQGALVTEPGKDLLRAAYAERGAGAKASLERALARQLPPMSQQCRIHRLHGDACPRETTLGTEKCACPCHGD